MKKLLNLILADSRSITRDVILLAALLGPLLIAMVFRWGLPFAATIALEQLAIDLGDYHSLLIAILLFLTSMIMGMLVGFIILDERDEDILIYLAVTPLSRPYYLAYRLLAPFLAAIVVSLVAVWIASLSTFTVQLVLVGLVASIEAPISALLLASLASNKVEGLAFSKLLGILLFAPVVSALVDSPWKYLAAPIPSFWLHHLHSFQSLASFVSGFALALLVHLSVLWLLYKKFVNKVF